MRETALAAMLKLFHCFLSLVLTAAFNTFLFPQLGQGHAQTLLFSLSLSLSLLSPFSPVSQVERQATRQWRGRHQLHPRQDQPPPPPAAVAAAELYTTQSTRIDIFFIFISNQSLLTSSVYNCHLD